MITMGNFIDKILGRDNKSDTKTTELEAKVDELQAKLTKSLNSTLAGIVGGQWIELNAKSYDNAYENNYVINRGITLLAQNIAQLPLDIYKGDNILDDGFRFPNFDPQNPNAEMSMNEWLYQCCLYYFYRGEFMSYINLEGSSISLEPVNPKLMKVKTKDNTGRVLSWEWNNKKIIPTEQLIYIKLINPDGERGLSPIDVVKEELINDDKARQYNTKYFENFGKVGGTLYDEKGLAQYDDMKRLVEQFNAVHQGSNNAHKTLGLPAGIKYQEALQTMKDMEFAIGRADIRDRILGILGIHKAVFGITESITYQTQKDAMRMLWQMTLQPNASRIQEKLNQQLFNKYFPGYQCYFDFDSVPELQENSQDILNQAKGYRELGYTLNEINEYFDLGMEDVTDPLGDMRFVPSSMIPVDDMIIDEETPSPPEKSINLDQVADKIAEFLETGEKKDINEKSHRTYINRYNKIQRDWEKKVAGKLGKYFSTTLGKVLAVVNEHKSVKAFDEIGILLEVRNTLELGKEALVTTLTPVYYGTAKDASTLILDTLKLPANPAISETMIVERLNMLKNINNTLYKLIRKEVSDSLITGETVDQLSKRLVDVFKFTSSRSRMIARTEVGSIMNMSIDEESKLHGVNKKEWVSQKDAHTRETHLKNDELGIKDYDYVYPNTQYYPMDGNGGPGENINCRCVLVPIVE